MIQVLRDDERLALFRQGRYHGLKGPGIVVCLPFLNTAVRLHVGDTGNLVTRDLACFGSSTIPVVGRDLSGSLVKIIGFDETLSPPRPRVVSV